MSETVIVFLSVGSRESAISSGELIDVSNVARDYGIHYPVVMSQELWEKHMLPNDTLLELGQTAYGRVRTTLHTFSVAAPFSQWVGLSMTYQVCLMTAPPNRHENVSIRAVIEQGDEGEPVVTLSLN